MTRLMDIVTILIVFMVMAVKETLLRWVIVGEGVYYVRK